MTFTNDTIIFKYDYYLNLILIKIFIHFKLIYTFRYIIRMDTLNEMKLNKHGTYEEILSEKEVLKITTTEKRVIAHFFHKDFRRCQILDGHLEVIYIVIIFHRIIYFNNGINNLKYNKHNLYYNSNSLRSISRPNLSRLMLKTFHF